MNVFCLRIYVIKLNCIIIHVGLVKGRGKAITETGIASMDLRRNILRMSQFCDDQLYSQLMTQVHMIEPAEVSVYDRACRIKCI